MKKRAVLVLLAALLPLAGCVAPYPYYRYGYAGGYSAYGYQGGYQDYGGRYGYRGNYGYRGGYYDRRADPYAGYDGYY